MTATQSSAATVAPSAAYLRAAGAIIAAGILLIAVLAALAEVRIQQRESKLIKQSLQARAVDAARTVETRLALLAERVTAAGPLKPAPAKTQGHSLLPRLGAAPPDPLIGDIAPSPSKSPLALAASASLGTLRVHIPPNGGIGEASDATLPSNWLQSVLGNAGTASFIAVAPGGEVVGIAGEAAAAGWKLGEALPLDVLSQVSPAGFDARTDARTNTGTAGAADRVASWTKEKKAWWLSGAVADPDLIVIALAPKPAPLFGLGPVIGLSLIPLAVFGLLFFVFRQQNRALLELETQNEASEELTRIMTGSSGCGLWDWDVDGGRIFWSSALLALTGRPTQGAWLTLPETYQVLHPTEVPKLERFRLMIADGAPAVETLMRLQTLQGRTIWCEARMRRWSEPSRERIVGLLVDVTAQVEAKLEAEAAVERLEAGQPEDAAPVADLNAAAQGMAELRATIQELEAKRLELASLASGGDAGRIDAESRAKSEFLANMSHELKTPLNAIIGFSEIMRDELYGAIGDERYRDYARDIHQSGRSLAQLIDDILEMSKIEAGRIALESESLDLGVLIEECIRLADPKAREAAVRIENRVHGPVTAFCDRRATKRILMSVLSNAIKFTHRGGRIALGASIDTEQVTLTVADDGIGIPEADLSRIGQPFEQVEKHQSRRHRGTGLGLAISKALSELQGGGLRIESSEGIGTTVFVTLPRRAKTDAPAETPAMKRAV